jgi:putative exosortase-associated protein (TIGR04073 family)
MTRVLRACAPLALLAVLGCATSDPLLQDVTHTRAQVEVLEDRVSRLEAGDDGTLTSMDVPHEADALAPEPKPSQEFQTGGAFGKLGRGFVNTVTGWVEIPKRVHQTSLEGGAFKGLTWGLARGFGLGFLRTAAGLYELVTFPFPAPPGYRTLVEPPFVFLPDPPA